MESTFGVLSQNRNPWSQIEDEMDLGKKKDEKEQKVTAVVAVSRSTTV